MQNSPKNDPRGNKSGDYGSGHEVLRDFPLFLDWMPVFLLDLIVVNYRADDAQVAFFIGVDPELPVAATSVMAVRHLDARPWEAASARITCDRAMASGVATALAHRHSAEPQADRELHIVD